MPRAVVCVKGMVEEKGKSCNWSSVEKTSA